MAQTGPSLATRPPSCRCPDVEHLEQEVENLRRALETRKVIGMALGIVIAREGCSPDEAFKVLVRASQNRNRKLALVAQDMVDRNTQPPGVRRTSPC